MRRAAGAEANRWVGELNAFSEVLPDVDLYIKMHVLNEAGASSRVEGAQTDNESAAFDETPELRAVAGLDEVSEFVGEDFPAKEGAVGASGLSV